MSHSGTGLRWGILGTGLIAQSHVIAALQTAERCELVAIASRSIDRAAELASQFGIPQAHGSYEDLLADPDIDCVYLPLPNHLHKPWIMQAADAGKHILCEKPLTLTSVDAAAAAAHCEARGVTLMEAFMYRFHPAWVTAQGLIADGAIGRVTDVSVWFSFRSTRPTDYRHGFESGGGALYDVGCYAVDVSRMLLGDAPSRVLGTARIDAGSGVDLTFSGILDYGESIATFTCSMEQEPLHTAIIHGTGGWLSIADPFNCPSDIATTITIGSGGDHHPHASTSRTFTVPAANQYGLQATALVDAIVHDEPAPVPIEGSIANMKLLERLFEAAGMQVPAG